MKFFLQKCFIQISYILSLVDCIWGEWQMGDCSEDCGGGSRINKRSPTVEASFGGKECVGSSNVTEICNIQECPGIYYFLAHKKYLTPHFQH